MSMIENPAYAAVVSGKSVVLSLAQSEDGVVTELPRLHLKPQARSWLVRQGMDVMLVEDWAIPIAAEERKFNTWIIRQANRIIGRVTVPQHTLRPNAPYMLSRALCIPERIIAPE